MRATAVLSSGFLAFASHIGFVKGAHRAGVVPARVCGTSSGAVIGALWAAGNSPQMMVKLVSQIAPWRLLRPRLPFQRGSRSLLSLDKFVSLLEQFLPPRFEDLSIPFSCGVVDRETRTPLLLQRGSLPEAVVASCAIPYLFAPRRIDGRVVHDGGAVDRLFLSELLSAHPSSRVIAHVVDGSPVRSGPRAVTVDDQLRKAACVAELSVVRSPRSGASFFSLGDVESQIESTTVRAYHALASAESR